MLGKWTYWVMSSCNSDNSFFLSRCLLLMSNNNRYSCLLFKCEDFIVSLLHKWLNLSWKTLQYSIVKYSIEKNTYFSITRKSSFLIHTLKCFPFITTKDQYFWLVSSKANKCIIYTQKRVLKRTSLTLPWLTWCFFSALPAYRHISTRPETKKCCYNMEEVTFLGQESFSQFCERQEKWTPISLQDLDSCFF